MKTKSVVIFGAVILGSVPAVAAASAPAFGTSEHVAHRTPYCHGLPATIVGRGQVMGTEEADVIITYGPASVESLGGDDRICLRGYIVSGPQSVDAGTGDDIVDNDLTGDQTVSAQLGTGSNFYIGGDDRDEVRFRPSQQPVTNFVHTYGGSDYVSTGTTGLTNQDYVDTGEGADLITLYSFDNSQATLHGGPGVDRLVAAALGPSPSATQDEGAWLFDNTTGTATLDGTLMATWTSLEAFETAGFGGSTQTFVGSEKGESANLSAADAVSVSMGGGDDSIYLRPDRPFDASIRGGAGTDQLTVHQNRDFVRAIADLEIGVVRFTELPGYVGTPMPGSDWSVAEVNSLVLDSPVARVTGDHGPNVLTGVGCDIKISGGGGGDTITSGVPLGALDFDCTRSETSPSRLLGGHGNDRLTGERHRDTILGGAGFDRADGREGRDICRAEVESNCEDN